MQYIPPPGENVRQERPENEGCVLCGALKRGAPTRTLHPLQGAQLHHPQHVPLHAGAPDDRPLPAYGGFRPDEPGRGRRLAGLLKLAVRVLGTHYHPQGFNAGMNLGRSAGAGVADHYHLHVIPRWKGDSNFMPLVGQTRVLTEDLDTTYERLFPLFEKERKRAARRTRKKKDPIPIEVTPC